MFFVSYEFVLLEMYLFALANRAFQMMYIWGPVLYGMTNAAGECGCADDILFVVRCL